MKRTLFIGLNIILLLAGCMSKESGPALELIDEAMIAGESNADIGLFQPHFYVYPSAGRDTSFQGVYEIDLNHDGHVDFELITSKCSTNVCSSEMLRLYMVCHDGAQVMVESAADRNIKTLYTGDTIDCYQTWRGDCPEDLYRRYRYWPPCGTGERIYGNWRYTGGGYIGLRVCTSYRTYGWLKITLDGANVTVEEIANQALRW